MSQSGTPSGSLNDVLQLIGQLRDKLQTQQNLSPEQLAAIEALIADYLETTTQLQVKVDSLMPGDAKEAKSI